MEKFDEFFTLLILNNPDDIKKFVIANGKSPKVTAAIRFLDQSQENQQSSNSSY